MAHQVVDLATWRRADQFRFFRTFDRPHYAITSRLDVTRIVTTSKATGISPYRACLYAIGTGLHAVPELLMRFRDDVIVLHDGVDLSMTVPRSDDSDSFVYAYVPYNPDFKIFDSTSRRLIDAASQDLALKPNTGERDDLAYLSCLPWMDFTSINNAMPGPDDCIPRVSWGKFVEGANQSWSMAMTLEVHHALVDGVHIGSYFAATQQALDEL